MLLNGQTDRVSRAVNSRLLSKNSSSCRAGTGLTQTSVDLHPTLRGSYTLLVLIIWPACLIYKVFLWCVDINTGPLSIPLLFCFSIALESSVIPSFSLQRCLFSVFNLFYSYFPPPNPPHILSITSLFLFHPSLPPPVSLLLMLCDRELIPYMPSRLSSVSLLPVFPLLECYCLSESRQRGCSLTACFHL